MFMVGIFLMALPAMWGCGNCDEELPDEPCGPARDVDFSCNRCGLAFVCGETAINVWEWRALPDVDCDCIDKDGQFDEDNRWCDYVETEVP